jgi:hypothetical protein
VERPARGRRFESFVWFHDHVHGHPDANVSVAHCHNLAHEGHNMTVGWEIAA